MQCDICCGDMFKTLGGDYCTCEECGEIAEVRDYLFQQAIVNEEYEEWSDSIQLDFND